MHACTHIPTPVMLYSVRLPEEPWRTAMRAADIWLVVRVPVLSEQITVVQPRVSTDGRLHMQKDDISCTQMLR